MFFSLCEYVGICILFPLIWVCDFLAVWVCLFLILCAQLDDFLDIRVRIVHKLIEDYAFQIESAGS